MSISRNTTWSILFRTYATRKHRLNAEYREADSTIIVEIEVYCDPCSVPIVFKIHLLCKKRRKTMSPEITMFNAKFKEKYGTRIFVLDCNPSGFRGAMIENIERTWKECSPVSVAQMGRTQRHLLTAARYVTAGTRTIMWR